MKHIFTFIFTAFTLFSVYSQKIDRWNIYFSGSNKFIPIMGYGHKDVGGQASSIYPGGGSVPIAPHYVWSKALVLFVGMDFGTGIHLPFYRGNTWSTGTNVGLEGGVSGGKSKYLTGIYFTYTLPKANIYVRKQWNNHDLSLSLGYQRTRRFYLSYNLLTAGLQFHNDRTSLEVYSCLYPQTYWLLTTKGESRPLVKISEVGIRIYRNLFDE